MIRGKTSLNAHAEVLATNSMERETTPFAVGAVLAAMAMVVIDSGVSNVALPTIAKSLAISPALSVLVITSYQTALVMALLPCAAIGERFGYRRTFVRGVALFVAASVASSLAPSLPFLIAARFFQGLGAAAVMALGVALMRTAVSDTRLSDAISWNALTVALSAAAGPAIGALVLSFAPWPWIYVVNLPIGLGVLLASRALGSNAPGKQQLDIGSIALNCIAFGSLVTGAQNLLSAPAIAVSVFVLGVLSIFALYFRERRKISPLMPLDLLSAPSFLMSVLASLCFFAGQTLGLIALPFYFQHGLALSTASTGLHMAIWPLCAAATATLASDLIKRSPSSLLCAIGASALAFGLMSLAIGHLTSAPVLLFVLTALCGVGFVLFQVPNNRNMFLAAPQSRSGAAGAMQGTARLSGQTAGAVILTLLFTESAPTTAPQLALGVGAGLVLMSGIISLLRTTS